MSQFQDRFRYPDKSAIAQRHSVMVIRIHRTNKWHIAFVPKGVRFGDPSRIHIFREYEFDDREAARDALENVYQEVARKAEALHPETNPVDKKS